MSKCPFHANSAGKSLRGEIESIQCPDCGNYRISKTALELIKEATAPAGWKQMITRRSVVSTRDMRALTA